MPFTFKLSRRLALVFAALTGGTLLGCSGDVPSGVQEARRKADSTLSDPLAAVGDTLFSDGFESGVLAWDDNYKAAAKTIVAEAARTGTRGLRVSYAPGADGGALSKFITRGDRVYLRAAVRFPSTWTGDTRLLLLRAAPATSPWSSFGIGGQCPSGQNWAVTNAVTSGSNLDLRFYSYFVGMTPQADGTCLGRQGVAGEVSLATYTAPLAVSKGVWHEVELEAQLNAVGQANGWQKVWLDGVLKGEWNGLTFRTSSLVQWNAVTLELSTGTITQAQSLDIDDVLVLPARPVAPPPPPPPAAETLFVDGFESGTLTLWDDNFNAAAHAVDAGAAASGTRGLRATYQSGSGAGSLSKFVTRRDRIYARATVRFPTNWTGDTKLLLLRAAPATNPWGSFGVAGQCPSGTNWAVTNATTTVPNLDLRFYTYFVGMRTESNGQCWGRYGVAGDGGIATYTAPLSVAKGVWHTVELEAQMNTVGQADGWQKMWLDGVLKGEWNGIVFRTSSALQWNAVTLELSSSTITQTQTLDIDDVVVLGSKPGSTAPTPPTAPPPTEPPPAPAPTLSQVILTPDTAIVSSGMTRQFAATGRMSDGSNTAVSATFSATGGTISSTGVYTAGATAGTYRVIATANGLADTSTVTVPLAPVATVQVTPTSANIAIAGTVQLQVTLRDAAGQVLSGRPVSWSTSNALVATINGTGNVTGIVVGTATMTAVSEGKSGTASISVTASSPAPPPPPSGTEPVYQAGTHRSLWSDGFESYGGASDLTSGGGAHRFITASGGLTGTQIVSGGAAEGQKYVRFDFQAAGTTTRLLEAWGVADAPVVVLTYMFRNTGTLHHGKQMILFKDNGAAGRWVFHTPAVVAPVSLANCFYNGGLYGSPKTADIPPALSGGTWNSDPTGFQYAMNAGYTQWRWSSINDGKWHRMTTRLTRERAVGEGRVEMWVDGIKVMEYRGDDPSRCEYRQVVTGGTLVKGFQFPTTTSGGGLTWAGGAWLDYDAIHFWTPNP